MTFQPPRIGPLSAVGRVTVVNSPVYISGIDTGYDCFPNLGPPEEIGPPNEGVVCPSDQSQSFSGIRSGGGGFGTTATYLVEIAGVLTTPTVAFTKNTQTGPPFNTGPLAPGDGYFAAVMIEGFNIRINNNFPPPAPNVGSATLVIDMDQTPDPALAPEMVAGHRYFSLPHGSYDTSLIYNFFDLGWCLATTFWVSNGQQPLIKQKAFITPFGGFGTVGLPNPPHAGNVLVGIVYTRDQYSSLSAPSASWQTSGLLQTVGSGGSSMQMFWKTVCT